jgi:hypothetical protein
MHYEIGISKKLIQSTFKISQLKLVISNLYSGHLLLSQPQPLHMVKNGTTSSHSNTVTHKMTTQCSQTHLNKTWIKHKYIFITKLHNPKNIKMKGNLILPLINGICGVSYRGKKNNTSMESYWRFTACWLHNSVLEQVQKLIGRLNIPAKNMTQLFLNAITKWHSVCPCRDVHWTDIYLSSSFVLSASSLSNHAATVFRSDNQGSNVYCF